MRDSAGGLAEKANNFGFLRLAFAMLVILSHSYEMIDANRSREILTRLFHTMSFGELAVDGFFLISGYLVTCSWENSRTARDYLSKRVLRIYPGFMVAFLLSLLVAAPLAGGDLGTLAGADGVRQAVRMLFLRGPQVQGAFAGLPDPQLNSAMWTISYEFRCYLVAMGLGALGLVRHRRAWLALTLALLTLRVAAPGLDIDLPQPVALVVGAVHDDIRFLAVFLCGGAFYLYRDRIRYHRIVALFAAVALFVVMFFWRLAETGVAVLGGYVLFWFALHVRAGGLSRIGSGLDLSYGVYLYAWPVQNLIIWQFRGVAPPVLFLSSAVLAAALGAASWLLVERPCLTLKRRIGRGAPAATPCAGLPLGIAGDPDIMPLASAAPRGGHVLKAKPEQVVPSPPTEDGACRMNSKT